MPKINPKSKEFQQKIEFSLQQKPSTVYDLMLELNKKQFNLTIYGKIRYYLVKLAKEGKVKATPKQGKNVGRIEYTWLGDKK